MNLYNAAKDLVLHAEQASSAQLRVLRAAVVAEAQKAATFAQVVRGHWPMLLGTVAVGIVVGWLAWG